MRVFLTGATGWIGTDKPLVFSFGTGLGKPGQFATETDLPPPKDSHPRAASEYARVALAAHPRDLRLAPDVPVLLDALNAGHHTPEISTAGTHATQTGQ
jgi:hypothetical protein